MTPAGPRRAFPLLWLLAGPPLACETGSSKAGAATPLREDAAAFRFDFQAPDAAPPPDAAPDAAPPDPAVCAALCGDLAACAGADDPDHLCDGIDAREIEAFAELCGNVCLADLYFAPSFAGRSECGLLLEQMRAVSPDLAFACVPNPPPDVPACDAFGVRVSECVAEKCENSAPVSAGLTFWLALSCEQSVAAGQIGPDRLRALPGASTLCDDVDMRALVGSLVGSVLERRTLTSLCFEGPALPPATCGAACEHLRPCLPPAHPLKNQDYCAFLCALDESLRDVLSCASRAPECGPLSSCFGP